MLLCVCSVTDHRRPRNVVRTSMIMSHFVYQFFVSYHVIHYIICDLLKNRHAATWSLFLNNFMHVKCTHFTLASFYSLWLQTAQQVKLSYFTIHLKVIYCFFLLFVNELSFCLLNDAKTFPRTQKDRPKLNFIQVNILIHCQIER